MVIFPFFYRSQDTLSFFCFIDMEHIAVCIEVCRIRTVFQL